MWSLIFIILSLCLVVSGTALATRESTFIARAIGISKYTIGFFVVAVISILPELLISFTAAYKGTPSLGLGTLLGSNVADLTLIFALIVLISGKDIKIELSTLKKNRFYPFLLSLPIILGLDGRLTRTDGLALMLAGVFFYISSFKNEYQTEPKNGEKIGIENIISFLFGLALLLLGSHFTVKYALELAGSFAIPPALIGILIIGLGTTMPEFFFSLKSVKKRHDEMAVGDILGTVLADATVVIGLIALISPFSFAPKLIAVSGMFMITGGGLLFYFFKNDKKLSKREAIILIFFWLAFVITEVMVNG